jgi:16S rRNA processing protein RimM
MRLWALLRNGERREVEISELWPHKSWLILKLASVDTMDDAEALKGAELQVPRSERAELEAGWTYLSDLVGCTVFDGEREIGRVVDVAFGAGEAPLLVVRSEGLDEVLKKARSEAGDDSQPSAAKLPYEIPFAEAYLDRVDIERKQVRMRLPDGLLDVNAPLKKERGR